MSFEGDKEAGPMNEPETVLPMEVKAMVVAALHRIDKRVRPNPLPVSDVCGWLLGTPRDEWFARVTLLKSVCISEGTNPVGTTWREKVDDLMKLVHSAEVSTNDPSPAMTPEELLAQVAVKTAPPPDEEVSEDKSEGDGSQETPDGLDSFTNAAGVDPDVASPPPPVSQVPPPPEPDTDTKAEPSTPTPVKQASKTTTEPKTTGAKKGS